MKKIMIFILFFISVLVVSCDKKTPTVSTEEPTETQPVETPTETQPVKTPTETQPTAPKDMNLLAHWKFQNDEEYYVGDIETDELRFIDLSGNGNDMQVVSEGLGRRLDIMSWDTGVDGEGSTSLKINNTLELAESVDPYDKEFTTYSGAYVSGKYLETIDYAPINFLDTSTWTIEIIFKISPDWNNAYNRYTGIFSRQLVSSRHDEPLFSMAMAAINSDDTIAGALGDTFPVGLQFVHIDNSDQKTNHEFSDVYANQWIHFMVVGERSTMNVYVNGELVKTITNRDASFTMSREAVKWEVGVGRKYGSGANSMNTSYPEGLIRRLFCGSISEIKFTRKVLTIEESLFGTLQ